MSIMNPLIAFFINAYAAAHDYQFERAISAQQFADARRIRRSATKRSVKRSTM